MDKRTFLKTGALVGVASLMGAGQIARAEGEKLAAYEPIDKFVGPDGKYALPALPYGYADLEPKLDAQTMELHHSKHHLSYVNGLNAATQKIAEAIQADDFSLIKHWERELAFHGGGHFLHVLFWNSMTNKPTAKTETLDKYLRDSFGSEENFLRLFKAASNSVEGSGWGMLCYQPLADKLVVLQAEKHHNQSQWLSLPILPIDVWEHAYYLKFQNRRPEC